MESKAQSDPTGLLRESNPINIKIHVNFNSPSLVDYHSLFNSIIMNDV